MPQLLSVSEGNQYLVTCSGAREGGKSRWTNLFALVKLQLTSIKTALKFIRLNQDFHGIFYILMGFH